jgi:hypothetical protein
MSIGKAQIVSIRNVPTAILTPPAVQIVAIHSASGHYKLLIITYSNNRNNLIYRNYVASNIP